MTCPLKHLALCAALCFTSCGGKQDASPAPSDPSHHTQAVDQDAETFPSETALDELDKIPMTPGTLKMSVGDFLKHVQEVLSTKRNVMVRLIATPSSFNDLVDMMKEPCEGMVLPGPVSEVTTEGNLFNDIVATMPVQIQYEHSTIFLRCRDDTYFANSQIGQLKAGAKAVK
jgi:hypothetical protein